MVCAGRNRTLAPEFADVEWRIADTNLCVHDPTIRFQMLPRLLGVEHGLEELDERKGSAWHNMIVRSDGMVAFCLPMNGHPCLLLKRGRAMDTRRVYRGPTCAPTPGITRCPERLMYMRAVVSAVGCMPLLDIARRFIAVLPHWRRLPLRQVVSVATPSA